AAARKLIAGVPWDRSGEPPPIAGNGGAMRAGPVGLRYDDPAERMRVADEHARVTHTDPRARPAAVLAADVVKDALAREGSALDEIGSAAWCEALAARVRSLDPALADGVCRLPAWLAGSEEDAAAQIAKTGAVSSDFQEWHGISPFATPSA